MLRPPAIGNAFAVLSNPEKRLRYDEYGSDHEHVSTGQARHYNYYTEFEADITPEEIFNVFFGGHFPTGWYLSVLFFKHHEPTLGHKAGSAPLDIDLVVKFCFQKKPKTFLDFFFLSS